MHWTISSIISNFVIMTVWQQPDHVDIRRIKTRIQEVSKNWNVSRRSVCQEGSDKGGEESEIIMINRLWTVDEEMEDEPDKK